MAREAVPSVFGKDQGGVWMAGKGLPTLRFAG